MSVSLSVPKPIREKKAKPKKKGWAHSDPVTQAIRWAVIARDRGCVASRLDAREHTLRSGALCPGADPCRGGRGEVLSGFETNILNLTVDHVQEGYGRAGRRATSDAAHLVTICRHHHISTGWAVSHKGMLRDYLARFTQPETKEE